MKFPDVISSMSISGNAHIWMDMCQYTVVTSVIFILENLEKYGHFLATFLAKLYPTNASNTLNDIEVVGE